MKPLLGTFAIFAAVMTQAADLSPVLDQQNVFPLVTGLAVNYDYSEAQTLTCGLNGILSRVNVEVVKGPATTNDLVLSLWSTASDGSLLTMLATSSLHPSAIPGFDVATLVSFDSFTQSVHVNPGEVIGIRLDAPSPNPYPYTAGYYWYYQDPGQYAGGRLFAYGGIAIDQANSDFYFQTFVTPVPEPATVFLSFCGVILWIQHRCKTVSVTHGTN